MRAFALAALAAFAAAAAGAAEARPWTDPQGRITFDLPAGWPADVQRDAEGFSYVIVGTANNECQVIGMPSEATAAAKPHDARRAGLTQASATAWATIVDNVPPVFHGQGTLVSQSVDTTNFWPIQRAEIQGPERLVHSALQIRPGIEIWTFCMTYGGPERMDVYDAFIRSVGTPRDAELQAEAERLQAEFDARQAAADAARAEQEQQQNQEGRRRNRD